METTFDSLGYFKKLKDAGFSEDQAKVQTDALREVIDSSLATKRDLKDLEYRLTYNLTLKLGGITVACSAIILALLPLILK
ncbi:MAG: DUF1640 domain-containing protein [Deltaproteobacteria bacterium]|nr:MAG: DUF1640 domain-containing protein [Deltaproteobacteria bacterium]